MCACQTNRGVGCIKKNESNCLLENKMVSTLIWKHVGLLYVVLAKHLMAYYLAILPLPM